MLEYEILRGEEFLDMLVQLVDSARRRVYIATYIATLTPWTEEVYYAAVRRLRAGVDVRFLLDGVSTEANRYNQSSTEFLRSLGVPVVRTDRFMHIKLYIVDNNVIVGSHNLAASRDRERYEVSVMFGSKRIASRLSSFFLSIYGGGNPNLSIDRDVLEDGTYYEIISNHRILDDIYEKTMYGSRRVKILMYIATLSKATRKYYRLLKNKRNEGIDVAVVLDGTFKVSRHYNTKVYSYLKSLGLDKVVLTSRHTHAKVVVIDDYTMIGSHNLTSSSLAGRMELAVVLRNSNLSNSMDYMVEDILAREQGVGEPS
ncbi:MAG: phosphatidylserine/phosphatidylglycerophosphate/cardiolipin synthase family protein [Sulfolobales archaeon]